MVDCFNNKLFNRVNNDNYLLILLHVSADKSIRTVKTKGESRVRGRKIQT